MNLSRYAVGVARLVRAISLSESNYAMSVTIVPYADAHFDAVAALWRDGRPSSPPWNEPRVSIPAKLAVQPELFLVALEGGVVVGTAMAGYDGHRGWLSCVAVLASCRRRGIGTALVHEAERRLQALGCVKVNLQVLAETEDAVAFYWALGYDVEARVSMGKRLGRFAK